MTTHPEMHNYIEKNDKSLFNHMAKKANGFLEYASDDNLHLNAYFFTSLKSGEHIDV